MICKPQDNVCKIFPTDKRAEKFYLLQVAEYLAMPLSNIVSIFKNKLSMTMKPFQNNKH